MRDKSEKRDEEINKIREDIKTKDEKIIEIN